MDRNQIAAEFYIEEHATLLALLYRAAVEQYGEEGSAASDEGIKCYGQERGARMAQRALADGRELSMLSYTQYSEWADTRGESKGEIAAYHPHYTTKTLVCGWCEAWKKHGLLDYGKNYCKYVDHALVKGFNPQNSLILSKTLADGDDCCHFEWLGVSFADEAEYKETRKLKAELSPRITKDFLYHTAHLLSAMQRSYVNLLGYEAANYILNKALEEFSKMFSPQKTNALIEESFQDFTKVS